MRWCVTVACRAAVLTTIALALTVVGNIRATRRTADV
jgi:hypothetical protein